jgi:predicted ATP-binding protein involved in virulence
MKILGLELHNFRNMKNKRITFLDSNSKPRNFTAIIGDNGAGKTAIIESITRGFTPIVRTISDKAVKECDLSNNDIMKGSGWTAVLLNVQIENEKFSWYNKRRLNTSIKYDSSINQNLDYKPIKSKYEECYSKEKLPLVLYYGVNRIINDIPKRGHIREFKISDALENCFDNTNDFRDFYEWFKTEEDNELREKADNPNYRNIKLDAVRGAIERMIRGYKNLRIRLNPSRMIITNSKGEDLRVEQLSGGYKAVLSLVSDIAKRLTLANLNSNNPLEEEAIVLIDELDLHLHPKWQKTIVADLKRTFPNCQFIITTHSPFIIQSLEKEELINLDKNEAYEEGSFAGWSIEEIQEYEMGVSSKTNEYSMLLEAFSNAIDEEDLIKAKEAYKTLIKMIHPSSYTKKIIDIDLVSIDD